jgi:hypothetical protein
VLRRVPFVPVIETPTSGIAMIAPVDGAETCAWRIAYFLSILEFAMNRRGHASVALMDA